MQLLFTMVLDVRSICTLVNKPLHVFHIIAAALKTTQAVVWQPQTSPGEGWGYRAVCWEQQRDLRAVNPAPATQEMVSGYFVLSHLLPWLHCQWGFKDIWMSVQAPEIPNSAVWKSSPWAASPSECCCWPVHTCHFSGTSCVPREHPAPSDLCSQRFLFHIPVDTSCSVFIKCYSCICITSNSAEPMGDVVHILHQCLSLE